MMENLKVKNLEAPGEIIDELTGEVKIKEVLDLPSIKLKMSKMGGANCPTPPKVKI